MIFTTGRGEYQLGHQHHRCRVSNSPYWIIGYFRYGVCHVKSDYCEFDVYPNSVGLVKPDVEYYNYCGSKEHPESGDIYAIFTPRETWHHLLNWPEIFPGYMRIFFHNDEYKQEILDIFEEIHQYFRSSLPERKMFAENTLEKLLLKMNLINPLTEHARTDDRILDAIKYINKNFNKPLTIKRIAKEVNMSSSRFAHLFREQAGATPKQFLEQQRLENAQQLLISTNKTIAQIAEESGFPNQFHFSTRFRKQLGKSPKEFRTNPGI